MIEKFFGLMVKGSVQLLRGSEFESLLMHFVKNLNKRLMVMGNKNSIIIEYNNKIFIILLKICFLFYYNYIISVGLTPAIFCHPYVGLTHA